MVLLPSPLSLVDFSKPSLALALALITFKPALWVIIARNEYKNKTLTRLFGGNARNGCYFLAFLILSSGFLRDLSFRRALEDQPHQAMLPEPLDTVVPIALAVIGQIFVLSSTWALGITGTFLGDYFGLLMDHRVEGFPFNVLRDPMYVGTTMSFVAGAFWYESPAGLLITVYIWLVYIVILRYETPFTDMIYSKREDERSKSLKKKN